MLVNALIIHNPTSPEISLKSSLPAAVRPLEVSSDDDDDESDDNPAVSADSSNTEHDTTAWHLQLAKSLLSMHHDMHVIITGFDEVSERTLENNIQCKKTKYELMRIALLLNPSELPTCVDRESTDPYMDLKEFDNTVQRDKLRSNILQLITKLKGGLQKLRLALLSPSYRGQSLPYAQHYRKRIAQCLGDIRAYLTEHPSASETLDEEKREDDELTKHKKTVNNAIAETIARNPLIEQRLVDYRLKVTPDKSGETHEFISSPVILMSSKSYERSSSIEQNSPGTVSAVKPVNFPDLYREASEFFDSESSTGKQVCKT